MSEKRGYPNPNYTEKDILPEGQLEMKAEVMIDDKDYRELVVKAALFDMITANVKANIDYNLHYNDVDEDFILAITGMDAYKAKKKAEEEKQNGQD